MAEQQATRLEAARTNSLTRSEEFDHADWRTSNSPTITADDAVAPDGTATADKVDDQNGSAATPVFQNVTVADDSLDRCVSIFVKKQTGGPQCALRLDYSGGSTTLSYSISVDVDDGSTVAAGGNTPTRSGVIDWNDDWWRIYVAGPNNGTGNTTAQLEFRPADSAGSATGFVHVWGAQLEGLSGGASFPSSYIPTTSSPVTRAADSLSFDISGTALATPRELTAYVKFVERGDDDLGYMVQIGNGNSGSAWFRQVVAGYRWKYFDSDDNVDINIDPSESIGDVVELRGVIRSSDITLGVSVNGGTENASSSPINGLASSWSADEVHINENGTGAQVGFNDFLAFQIAPGVRTMDEMRSLAGTA